ncbi:MAG: flagellin, partial [Pseudomonadota bacterium]
AVRNANDGISLSQTAEGALGEIGNNLQRIRELAVQSANASNSASDRASLQAEAAQLTAEITRVAGQTQFNGTNLLDGSFLNQSFQVGANANQTINIASIGDARASALGSHTLSTGGTKMSAVAVGDIASLTSGVTAETNLTITTADGGTTSAISYAASTAGSLTTTGGAREIAAAINSAASSLGITATATNSTTLSSLSAAGTVSFNLNGSAISTVITDQNDLSSLVSSINGVQNTTGVTASFTSTSSKSNITLSTTDGRNIVLDTFANNTAGNQTVSFGGSTLTEGAAATISAVKTGTVSLASSKGAISTANADAVVFTTAGVNNSTFSSVAALDLSSSSGAQTAITSLDAALAQINSSRGDLGAMQNRFGSTIANLQSASENLSASRSRIQDADFAAESANLTRGQILQQAGVAILAQANSLPNNVLSLLR